MKRLLPLILIAACTAEVDPVVEDLEALARTADRTGGCGDVDLYGANSTDTRAIFVNLWGFATDAHQAGTTLTGRIDLASPTGVSVRAQSGQRLTSATCVGAYPFPGPAVQRSWQAVGGTLDYRIIPDPSGSVSLPIATAEVRIRDLEMVDASGRGFFLRRAEFPPTGVGLYPP